MNAQTDLSSLEDNVGKSKMIQVTWAAAQPTTSGGLQRDWNLPNFCTTPHFLRSECESIVTPSKTWF